MSNYIQNKEQCQKCIDEYSSMDDEPYLCGIRPCPLIQRGERMNIGFDLDGVLCELDIPIMHLFNRLSPEGEKHAERYYYNFRKRILNPEDFLHRGDKYYIITARHIDLYDVTKAWCDKYCPNYAGLYVVGERPWYETGESHTIHSERATKKKAEIIRKHNIKIHFEDSPRVVAQLRELLPDVIIVQYAGRL